MGISCVHCGECVEKLLQVHSPGNVELSKCKSCGRFADPYLELEPLLVVIDLILHKRQAYHHVIFNWPSMNAERVQAILMKGLLVFLLDSCRQMNPAKGAYIFDSSWPHFVRAILQMLVTAFLELGVLLACIRGLLHSFSSFSSRTQPKSFLGWLEVAWAVTVSSFFKLIIFAMAVWDFSSSMKMLVNLAVYSSHAVAVQVLAGTSLRTAGLTVAVAALAQASVESALQTYFSW